MSLPKSLLALATVFSSACLLAGNAGADQPNPESGANSPDVQVSLRNEAIVGSETGKKVQRAYLTSGTNQFVFEVPAGFQMDASNPQKIVLSDVNCTCFLTFRFAGRMPAGAKELQTDSCRSLALSRFPGAKISNESYDFAGNHGGPVFDLQWQNSSGTEQTARIMFIPSPAGIIEFNLLTTSSKFSDGRSLLNSLLGSFHSNEGGKLEVTQRPDKS